MKTRNISWIVLLTLTLSACGQTGGPASPRSAQTPPPDTPSADGPKPVEIPVLSTPMPDSPAQDFATPDPSNPEFQKLMAIAVEDLAGRLSIPSDQIQLKEAMDVTWPDSSLGCPTVSTSYLQVLTPGYLIRLQAADRTFEYHTDKTSLVIYCESPSPLPLDSLPRQ